MLQIVASLIDNSRVILYEQNNQMWEVFEDALVV